MNQQPGLPHFDQDHQPKTDLERAQMAVIENRLARQALGETVDVHALVSGGPVELIITAEQAANTTPNTPEEPRARQQPQAVRSGVSGQTLVHTPAGYLRTR